MRKPLKELLHKDWWLKYLPVILLGVVLCLLLFHTAASLVEWYYQWENPRDLDYAEGWHAYVASQSYPGGEQVGSSYEMPYNTLPYPPISYLFHGWMGKLVGTDLVGVRTIGRTTSLLMTLLNSIIIFLMGRAIGVRLLWSAIAALLFLTSQEAHFFAVSLRPDEMALAFMLLGLYTILRWRNYWLIGALFALTLATKHSFISVPLVLTVTLLTQRDFRSLLKFLASGCLVGLLIFAVSTWILGPYWWQGSLLQGFHGADFKQAIFFIGEGFTQPVLVIGVASVMVTRLRNSGGFIAVCFLVSLCLNSVALVKVGAAPNYFLEPVALASILTGYLAEKVLDKRRLMWRAFAFTLVLALIIPSTVEQAIAAVDSLKARGDTDLDPKPVVELLRRTERPILADQAWLYFESGHQPFVSPPDLIMAGVEGGKIDGRPMQEFIEDQGFKAIAVRQNWKERRHFPQAWISAIEKNYQPLSEDYVYIVMQPKNKS
ncbi:hypothetical protein IQ258_13800 [Coleofasciculus sp. LEGE 07081]|nr:hypothetical protein [Coleofasciculus sp. LEGE 07081]MBE9127201.1 hypothetical protein [Coleofasciculus sp. LEGE 07081]